MEEQLGVEQLECYRSSNNEATEWLENTGIANIKNLNNLVNILAKPIN